MTAYPLSIAIAPYTTIPVAGIGGTAPYTYAVTTGNGTIDSNGLYTAPGTYEANVITITDSLSATATIPVMVGSAAQLVCDVIQVGMGLANGRVYLWDQKENQPEDSSLYIAVQVLTAKPFGNFNNYIDNGAGLTQVQQINMQATVTADLISRGLDALNRKEEFIMALKSTYAEQQMELNGFYISSIPTSFVNLSEIDGAAIPYRFNISFNMQYMVTKKSAINSYGDFSDPQVIVDP